MGFLDSFMPDGTVEMKHTDYYKLMREAAKAELMLNAVICNVPHEYIRETMSGKQEDHPEITVEELRTTDEFETILSAATSLFSNLDAERTEIAANSLKKIIDVAEEERINTVILENDRRLKKEQIPPLADLGNQEESQEAKEQQEPEGTPEESEV